MGFRGRFTRRGLEAEVKASVSISTSSDPENIDIASVTAAIKSLRDGCRDAAADLAEEILRDLGFTPTRRNSNPKAQYPTPSRSAPSYEAMRGKPFRERVSSQYEDPEWFRSATLQEYADFVFKYLKFSSNPQFYFRPYLYSPERVYVPLRKFKLGNECGSFSETILLPHNSLMIPLKSTSIAAVGHNTVLSMDPPYVLTRHDRVVVFDDPIFMENEDLAAGRRADESNRESLRIKRENRSSFRDESLRERERDIAARRRRGRRNV